MPAARLSATSGDPPVRLLELVKHPPPLAAEDRGSFGVVEVDERHLLVPSFEHKHDAVGSGSAVRLPDLTWVHAKRFIVGSCSHGDASGKPARVWTFRSAM